MPGGKLNVKLGRWQEIKYSKQRGDDSGELKPYVRFRNQRLYLENFMRSTAGGNGEGFREESIACGFPIHGVYGTSYFSAYFIHLNEDGDAARVVYAHW